MYRVKFVSLAIILATLAVVAFMLPPQVIGKPLGGRPLTAILTGEAEVAPGDPDGSGLADLTLNSGLGEICFEIKVDNIAAPTRAHIHAAPAGQNGGIVVFFFDTVIDPPIPVPADLEGCVEGVDRDLIKEIRKNPQNYYVNIHNAEFPGGAIRGQLFK